MACSEADVLPIDAESASGWQCAGPEWQESAPADFNHSKRLS